VIKSTTRRNKRGRSKQEVQYFREETRLQKQGKKGTKRDIYLSPFSLYNNYPFHYKAVALDMLEKTNKSRKIQNHINIQD